MREELLKKLPPYIGNSIVITEDQTVPDIVFEILDAHKHFAQYYDDIALSFDADTTEEICNKLANFCRDELYYKEESEADQTTMLPAGILTRGADKKIGVDCKHFSSFCGGVLDALNRTGKNIKWCYRFASYKLINKMPHHVFVVVNPGGNEIWIDATPKSDKLFPLWYVDKKVKANMALNRIISGHQNVPIEFNAIGAGEAITIVTNHDNLDFDGTHKYAGVFDPYLALSNYADFGGSRSSINQGTLSQELNNKIAAGPSPGHTVDGDFVKWVYDNNIRSWNFYYPMGVKPGFNPSGILPLSYPRLVITSDNRLNFDRDVKIDDYRNAEIHLLTAWAQDMINRLDTESPYPITPKHLKEFSQGLEGGFDSRNIFAEPRGTSFFQQVLNSVKDAVEFVSDGVIKIIGSIPRNSFLALVGINAFNFARNLQDKIDAGKWNDIKAKWEKLGGNPDRLYNTIQDGKDKAAILGDNDNAIGEPISISALIATAAPIIAFLMTFLNDENGKIKEAMAATKNLLAAKYPSIDFSPLGFLDVATGQVLDIQIDPRDNELLGGGNDDLPGDGGIMDMVKRNPLPAAGIGAVAAYYLMKKPGAKPNYLLPAVVGAGIYFFITTMGTDKRKWLVSYITQSSGGDPGTPAYLAMIQSMPLSDIDIVYEWFKNYVSKGISVPTSTTLYQQIMALDLKYPNLVE